VIVLRCGNSNKNTVFVAVKNAIYFNKVTGGSSGGSAVNVAKVFIIFLIVGDEGRLYISL